MRRRNAGFFALVVLLALGTRASASASAPRSSSSARRSGTKGGDTKKRDPVTKRPREPLTIDRPRIRESTPEERARAKRMRVEGDRPPGTISASPELEHRHGQTPSGFDPAQARARAQAIAAHLARRGPRAYSHDVLARWQVWAGIRADGTYGGSSRGALVWYGAEDPPRPFVAPYATLPYRPPNS